MDIYVFIYPPGETTAVPAGLFSYEPSRLEGRFVYGRRYAVAPDSLPVDPVSLPLGHPAALARNNGGLYGAFRDASPDHWGRLVIAHQLQVAPEELNEGELLLNPNALRIGNLDFRPRLDSPEPVPGPPQYHQLAAVIEAAERIESNEPITDFGLLEAVRLLEQGSSLGGARPKCTVEHEGVYWVAKFPAINDTWNNPRVEWATMRLAEQCGIKVPEMRLERVGAKDVLMLRRFDRVFGLEGRMTRLGYLSALSVLGLDETDREHFSYLALADAFRVHGIGNGTTLEQLFRRMVFNILCRNTDDHPRNHGVLYDGSQGDLSPAFDIIPAVARRGVGEDFSLSMTIGAQGRRASVPNALSKAARFGLTDGAAREIVCAMGEAVAFWREEFQAAEVSDEDIARFEPSFASEHLRAARDCR